MVSFLSPYSHFIWASQPRLLSIFLEDVPLALGPNFGLLVEFWVQLPHLKTQVHVVIALGMPRGNITKTPLTFLATPLGSRDQHFQKKKEKES